MKTQNIIRILAGLSFLIFFCPFFQMCSDRSPINILRTDSIEQHTDDLTLNAYELSLFVCGLPWLGFFFAAIVIFSVIIFIRSFTDSSFSFRFFCYMNLIMAFGFLLVGLICFLLNDIRQIKYGFYLFLINTIVIIILCKRQYNLQN
jgi:hypothetical protein